MSKAIFVLALVFSQSIPSLLPIRETAPAYQHGRRSERHGQRHERHGRRRLLRLVQRAGHGVCAHAVRLEDDAFVADGMLRQFQIVPVDVYAVQARLPLIDVRLDRYACISGQLLQSERVGQLYDRFIGELAAKAAGNLMGGIAVRHSEVPDLDSVLKREAYDGRLVEAHGVISALEHQPFGGEGDYERLSPAQNVAVVMVAFEAHLCDRPHAQDLQQVLDAVNAPDVESRVYARPQLEIDGTGRQVPVGIDVFIGIQMEMDAELGDGEPDLHVQAVDYHLLGRLPVRIIPVVLGLPQ
ncbi:MAG: hypothetical protein IKR86_00810 [Candidatus Methanomethylophilaceae archaeon]|nr:hypothetical protein [Candidatus Methanomethylophilaceae archaeon]